MIIKFLANQFNRYNIDNRKTRVYIPSLFVGYLVVLFCISVLLKNLFPFEGKAIISESDKELNLLSTTLFLIFAAIMEEFKYRGLLTKFNYKWVLISLSTLVTSIIFLIFNVKVYYLYPESIFPMLGYIIVFSFITSVIYFILFKTLFGYQEHVRKIFDTNFNLVVWVQVFLFAMWHILFSGQANERHYISIFIMSSISALFLTYIRMNYGILYSIIVHFLHNFFISLVPIILIRWVS